MSLVEKALRKMQQTAQGAVQSSGRGAPAEAAGEATAILPLQGDATATARPPARVVEINRNALRTAGLLPPEHEERHIARQYRQIKRPLIASAMGIGGPAVPNGRVIMVASAVPGEGKTFTSVNLALSMALEPDIHVLLVDADLPKPHISRLLGVSEQPGLLDALQDPTIDVESLILPLSVPGLSVLPAGRSCEHATELLASRRMQQVVARLLERDPARIVLFDSAPLLPTTEAQALAHVVGQVLLVVRSGHTPQQVVLDAIGTLGEDKPVSLVLNQHAAAAPTSYYYYGSAAPGGTAPAGS